MNRLSIRRDRSGFLLHPWEVSTSRGMTLGRFHTWQGALDYVLRRRTLQKAAGREDYWFSTQARDAGWRKLGEYAGEYTHEGRDSL